MTPTRKLLVVLTAVALVLAACGRDDTSEGDGDPDGDSATASTISEGAATGSITVWAMGTEGENLGTLADGFMELNPDADIEVTAVPWDAAHDRIQTAVAGGQTPDASLLGSTWVAEFAATGGLDQTPDAIDASSFFEGAWDTNVVDGTTYGVPWYVETRLIYYRTDLAEEAGFAEPPETWEDLKNLAMGMQEAGADDGIQLPAGGTGAWQTYMPFIWQAGGGILDEAGENFVLDSEANIEALTYYKSFFDEGLSPTSVEEGELEAGFADGSVGMFVSGPWHIGLIRDTGLEDEAWSVAHMPMNVAATSFIGGGNLTVFTDAANRDTAWKFVEYLSQPEVQITWYQEVSDLPAVMAAWDDPALSDDPLLAVFGRQLEDAKSAPPIATWEQIADVMDREVERMVLEDRSPADTAAAMQEGATAIGTGS